jgi:hypothetical protein
MQTLPQVVYGSSHTKLQLFLTQTDAACGGALQPVWQPPQLSASVANVTQRPPHTVSPSSQLPGGSGIVESSLRKQRFVGRSQW